MKLWLYLHSFRSHHVHIILRDLSPSAALLAGLLPSGIWSLLFADSYLLTTAFGLQSDGMQSSVLATEQARACLGPNSEGFPCPVICTVVLLG